MATAEAKNDNLCSGLGQCIAATVAASEFNARASMPLQVVHGAVTTGSAWKFLRLSGTDLTLDVAEYFIAELDRIMGILAQILETCRGREAPSTHFTLASPVFRRQDGLRLR